MNMLRNSRNQRQMNSQRTGFAAKFWSRFFSKKESRSSPNKTKKRAHPDRRSQAFVQKQQEKEQQQQQQEDGANCGPILNLNDDSTTVTDSTYSSSLRSIDTSSCVSLQEEEEVTPPRTTLVRFHDEIDCIEFPRDEGTAAELFYSTPDFARFKEDYAADVQTALQQMDSDDHNDDVVRVLQQTYRACQQVCFETKRCILSQKEEDQLLDCLELYYVCPFMDQPKLQLWGLEHNLATHALGGSGANSTEERRRHHMIRIMLKLTNINNGSSSSRSRTAKVLEQKSRADRLFARIIGQAQAVLLKEQQQQQEEGAQ